MSTHRYGIEERNNGYNHSVACVLQAASHVELWKTLDSDPTVDEIFRNFPVAPATVLGAVRTGAL